MCFYPSLVMKIRCLFHHRPKKPRLSGKNLIVNPTFDGYRTEINTTYGKLQKEHRVNIKPAPDKWDRTYNVGFYIEIGEKYIGIQIKPVTYEQTPELYKWKQWLAHSHKKFKSKFGCKVFNVFSIKENNRKEIYNDDVIDEIREEIRRLETNKEK